jgi:hypothetical protein
VFSGEDFAAASVRSVVANSNGAGGVRVDSNGAIAVSDVTAIANGETGIALAGGSVHLSGASAAANDGYGLALFDAGRATVAGRAASARSELGGVRAQASPLGGPPPLRVTVLASRFEGNALGSIELQPRVGAEVRIGCSDFLANGPAGLTLLADLTVDARSNFWGDPSGPDHPGNPGGTGDVIRDAAAGLAGTVLYQPFSSAPPSAADCPVEGAIEIPALDRVGLTVLALLIASGALGLLGRGRRAG